LGRRSDEDFSILRKIAWVNVWNKRLTSPKFWVNCAIQKGVYLARLWGGS